MIPHRMIYILSTPVIEPGNHLLAVEGTDTGQSLVVRTELVCYHKELKLGSSHDGTAILRNMAAL